MATQNPANSWCFLCAYYVPGPVLGALGTLSHSSPTAASGMGSIPIPMLETVAWTGEGSRQAHGWKCQSRTVKSYYVSFEAHFKK